MEKKVKTRIVMVSVVALAFVAVVAIIVGVVFHPPQANGLMVRRGFNGDSEKIMVELRTAYLPIRVVANNSIYQSDLRKAIEWWNKKAGRTVFSGAVDDQRYNDGVDGSHQANVAYMSISEIDSEHAGKTIPRYDRVTGTIVRSIMTINRQYAQDKNTLLTAMVHELGHTIGLDDDEHTVSVYSVMDEHVINFRFEDLVLTDQDERIVLEIP